MKTADNKKEQERDELHRAIWAIADEFRGADSKYLRSFITERGAVKYELLENYQKIIIDFTL